MTGRSGLRGGGGQRSAVDDGAIRPKGHIEMRSRQLTNLERWLDSGRGEK